MTSWAALAEELARWHDDGRPAELWWRDDDAADVTPALSKLFNVARASGVPLALAVVPAALTPGLAGAIRQMPLTVQALQHGYGHVNHATGADKKIELGAQRPAPIVIGEIATGKLALENALGNRAAPVLVPPWNRIAPYLVPTLPEMGYRGLSQFGVRKRENPVPGLRQVNCHLDLIDWRGTRGFVGEAAALTALIGHLRMRREAWTIQPELAREPSGVMSHHAVHDERTWEFLARLFDAVRGRDLGRWLSANEVFAL